MMQMWPDSGISLMGRRFFRHFCIAILLGTLLFCGFSRTQAATIQAASPSLAAVTAAINSATDGDTVSIPAGTADWTSTLNITKAITLQGNGAGSTIITTSVPLGSSLIHWNLVANKVSRMTGIEFQKGTQPPNYMAAIVLDGVNTDGRRMRIDHCQFTTLGGSVLLTYATLGVFDHNTVVSTGTPAWLGYMKGNSWNSTQGVNTFGDGAWAAPDQFGSDQFFFIEDNIFTNTSTTAHVTLLDSQAGARYVFRYNKVYKGSLESHGLEASRERSGRAFEVYYNTFDGIDTQNFLIYFRGGVGLVFSNYVYGYTTDPKLHLLNNRLKDSLSAPFGGADGRNPWDSNDPQNPFATGTVSSGGPLTLTDTSKVWVPNQWQGYILKKTSGKAVSSMTRSGSTVTVNCASHGFTNNQCVSIFGAAQQPYNTVYNITYVNANQFTVQNAWTPGTPATGTIFAVAGNYFSEIVANTLNQLTFRDSLYGAPYTMTFNPGDAYEINKVTKAMDMTGVGAGPDLAGAVSPNVVNNYAGSQVTSAWYGWSNIRCLTGPATIGAPGTSILFAPIPLLLIVPNVHYFDNTVKPGYVPYTHPHPLVSGQTGGPPPPPSGLHVVGGG